ncbi:MAG: sulfite exporter TauE/SafE family protein [Lentisphaerae bacterium]|nr:sulfite exporter TauE/SafE family protein [Lentisphaerota bacterium]
MSEVVLQSAVMLFSAFMQATVGFAFSLFAVPLMLLVADSPLPQAVMMVILSSTLQRTFMVCQMHPHVPWRRVLPAILTALLMLPVGIYLMHQLAATDRLFIRRVVGGIVLALLLFRWRRRSQPRDVLARAWAMVAGALSGLLQGLANIGGPPLVIWLHAQRLSPETLRVTISAITLPQVPVQVILMLATFGMGILPPWTHLVALLVAAAVGHMLGMQAGRRLPVDRLRTAATVLLVLICISAILGARG